MTAPSESFSGAAVTEATVNGGRVAIRYRTVEGASGEVAVNGLPPGLSFSKHALLVSSEVTQAPDGPRSLTTASDASGPVLLLGRNVGLGQKLLNRFAFVPGKVLGPVPEPRRQAVTVVVQDREGHRLAEATPGQLLTLGSAPDAWQLVVSRASTGQADDEGPPLSVDLVLVKQ